MNLEVLISDYFSIDEFGYFKDKIFALKEHKNDELMELYNSLHPVK